MPPQMKTLTGVPKLKWTYDILHYQIRAIKAGGYGYARPEAVIRLT